MLFEGRGLEGRWHFDVRESADHGGDTQTGGFGHVRGVNLWGKEIRRGNLTHIPRKQRYAVPVALSSGAGALGQENADDDHHQANNGEKKGAQIKGDNFLKFGAHPVVIQTSTFCPANADDTVHESKKTK